METILLNDNFKMEFLPSKRLGHADSLSRLIPKLCDPLEETLIAALRREMKIKSLLCNTTPELPVTLEEISIKEKIDTKKKKQISSQHYKKNFVLSANVW